MQREDKAQGLEVISKERTGIKLTRNKHRYTLWDKRVAHIYLV